MSSADEHLMHVGIKVNSQSVHLYHDLARILKKHHNARLHLYTKSVADERGLARRDKEGLWDSVTASDRLNPALEEPVTDPDGVIARARAWELRIGETINRLTHEHRQLGRGYAPGGELYPRQPSVMAADYIQMLHAFNEALDFWEKEISEKNLTLVIDAEKWGACVCRAMGVTYRRLCLGRHENYHYWAVDEYFTNARIESIYNGLRQWPEAELERGYSAQTPKTEKIMAQLSVFNVFKAMPMNIARMLIHSLRGLDNRRIPMLAALATMGKPLLGHRRHRRFATTRLADLGGKPFVYFPLHKEPETDFTIRTPEYLNQQAAIMSLSRDLPAGTLLALKEHLTAPGWRPRHYHQQLADMKNVVFFNIFEPSIPIIKKAAATATILGTAGLEAAVLGRPVIYFGRHNLDKFLPHVMTVTDESQIRDYLEFALGDDFDTCQARDDGARFLQALKDSCFHMGTFNTVHDTTWGAMPEDAETLYGGLKTSLEPVPETAAVLKTGALS